jgi:ABC-2 type transport system permease protein
LLLRVIDLAIKDLKQIVRDWRAAVFLIAMPIAFTLLFGFAFGGFGSSEAEDPRLPVGFIDNDTSPVSHHLLEILSDSKVISLIADGGDQAELQRMVDEGELAAAVIVPSQYGERLLADSHLPIHIVADTGDLSGSTAVGGVQAAALRMANAVDAAQISTQVYQEQLGFDSTHQRQQYIDEAMANAIAAWDSTPIKLETAQSRTITEDEIESGSIAFAQSSPGMMAQFAIAGLMGASSILVIERKSGSMRRLLTTNLTKVEILLGHYIAMFIMIFAQLFILILFGQLLLRLNYAGSPLATLVMIASSALFAASLGLLIGALAKTEEQVIVFALIPMFLLAGLGGAWVPLEIMPEGVRQIAALTPVAWIMGGFQNIILRGLGLESVLLAAGVLVAYSLMLVGFAVWRFRFE